MSKQTIKVEKLLARARFDSSSFNKEKRTVDVVLATDTLDVLRYDWLNDVVFAEQLVISAETIRMARINAGAPFLDNHNSYGSVRDSLGKVVNDSARIGTDGKLRCTLQFSTRTEVAGVMQDVADGILENISVGYNVYKYERQPVVDGETPVYRAIDWEPYEASLVNIAADINAGVGRAKQRRVEPNASEMQEVEIIDAAGIDTGTRSATDNNPNKNHLNNTNMTLQARALAVGLPATATEPEVVAAERKAELTKRALAVGLTGTATEIEIETAERAAIDNRNTELAKTSAQQERKRVTDITELVRKMKLAPEFGDKLITDGITLDAARALVIDEIAKTDANFRSNITVTGKDEVEKKREAVIAGMVIRSGALDAKEITKEDREISKEYRSLSLLDLAKMCLENERAGSTKGLDKMEIAKRAITSSASDFPVLLEGTNRRILLAAYNTAPDTWRQFCGTGSVGDFREWKRLRPGSFTRLDALAENGEYKTKPITDAHAEKVSASTFGNIINISRVMIVNDDLQGFASVTKALGRAAARGIEIDVFKLLALNGGKGPVMADGNTLFHASHKNLVDTGAGGVPSMATFEAIRVLFANQTDKDANDYLDLRAAFWLGPTALQGTAKIINGSLYDPDAANKLQRPNIVSNMFKNTIGTPRLTGNPWYAFADPVDIETIEVSFLDGQESPFLESEMPFNFDGISWKVRQDYGVGAVDWKGAAVNMGA